jgi:tetratricopeptide (TPR) repeat protein
MNVKFAAVCRFFLLGLGFLISLQSVAEVADYACGSIRNPLSFGPFDYRKGGPDLRNVETNHMAPDVVNLVKGQTGYIGSDLDYTLRAFPNHPLALMLMVRLGEKERTSQPRGAKWVVECYFKRAMTFANDDGAVRAVYAVYLYKAGRKADALNRLNEAIQLGEDTPSVNYNIGLIYFDMKDYDKALSFAHRAYGSGFPLPGLRDKLKKAGKWQEPVARRDSGDGRVASPEN